MDKKLILNLQGNIGQDKQKERYHEVSEGLRQIDYADPIKGMVFKERHSKGCFGCLHSQRGPIKGIIQSYCKLVEDGILEENNYPDETKDTCQYFCERKKKRLTP